MSPARKAKDAVVAPSTRLDIPAVQALESKEVLGAANFQTALEPQKEDFNTLEGMARDR